MILDRIAERIWPWSEMRLHQERLQWWQDISRQHYLDYLCTLSELEALRSKLSEAKRKEIETKRRNRLARDPIVAETHGDMA